ncbi:MAG: alpha/beta fold hydrolase [Desulfobacterales bacterium]
MNLKNITFTSDGFLLKGTLHLPETDLPPVVIGSHGLLSTGESPKQIALARGCSAHGIAYFRFDHRGCGQSDGVFNEVTSLEARCNDLISAAKAIQLQKGIGDRIGLFGSSMGGAVCMVVAEALNVKAMVTYASPVRSASVAAALKKSDDVDAIQPLFNQKHPVWDISETLKKLHNIFILHGDSDVLVPPSNAHEIYTKSNNPKKLIIQKGGDHRMSNKKHQEDFVRQAALWFKKWMVDCD